jgi:aryl-alcohol dehydrogenase-like predicted oxidoreductase
VKEESVRRNDRSMQIAKEVMRIADEIGHSPAQVAINWTRQRNQVVIPIVGARKPEQLSDSLGATHWQLSDEHMEQLNAVSAVELTFPHEFLRSDGVKDVLFGGTFNQVENHQERFLR